MSTTTSSGADQGSWRKGQVKWFAADKGFGFIVDSSDGRDVFVHYSNIEGGGMQNLKAEERVMYLVKEREKGPVATLVRRASKHQAPIVIQPMRSESTIVGKKLVDCEYGENGHQRPAALYSCETSDPLAVDKFEVCGGGSLSHNNWADLDRALQTITHIAAARAKNDVPVKAIAVGVKHGNACGATVSDNPADALRLMMLGDTRAIFGGVVMTNFGIHTEIVGMLAGKLLSAVIAPVISPEAREMIYQKSNRCKFVQNLALATLGQDSLDTARRFRYVRGGFLRQPNYLYVPAYLDVEACKPEATPQQWQDLLLAWAIGSTSNSNTITLVRDGQLIGNGVGQQDRVGAAELAISRAQSAGHGVSGSVAYSDSFFPFPDGPQKLIDAGVRAILTSSGSKRDKETVEVCESAGVVLCMIPDPQGRGFYGH
jgi:phosphoribosylaminoimidazolecarboxamide formyltransferase / IMP cyclohydrolase